ncbi:MAG TPA: hypothetical protein VF142_06710 [Longimicrobium sp.]
MKKTVGIAALGLAMVLASTAGFILPLPVGPQPLQAQECGNHAGKLCEENCFRLCPDNSCCGWTYKYYPKIDPT